AEENDASGEEADGARIGGVEAGGKLARIVVAEQRRAQAIEALGKNAAAAFAVQRILVRGEREALRHAEPRGIEATKGRGHLRKRLAFITRFVGVGATERSGERYVHLHPRGRRPDSKWHLCIARAVGEMAAGRAEGTNLQRPRLR